MAELKFENIYVDLDAILDTRLGAVAQHDPALAETWLSENYHTREADICPGLDRSVFKALYAKRDVETLKHSLATGMVRFVRETVTRLAEQAIDRPFHAGAVVHVNTYPYSLSEEEFNEFGVVLVSVFHEIAQVKLVHIPPKELTPQFIDETFSLLIKYDYEDWLEIQSRNFEKKQIPGIELVAPALYFGEVPSQEEVDRMVKESMHPLEGTQFLTAALVCLRLIAPKHFSVLMPTQTS